MRDLHDLKLCVYLPDLKDNGVTRLYLALVPLFISNGVKVTLLLDQLEGALAITLAASTPRHVFGKRRFTQTFPSLVTYLRANQPDILLTAHKHKSLISIWAKAVARVRSKNIIVLHMPIDPPVQVDKSLANRVLPLLMRLFLRYADHIVSVSYDMAAALSGQHGIDNITVIQNGIVGDNFDQLVNEPVQHRWLRQSRTYPVFISAGRLNKQKDYPTLLRAFALYRETSRARLIIFGEGEERQNLTTLAAQLRISADLDMPGFTVNILPCIRNATAFILTSAFEVLPLTIIEALACGTPVISSNCEFGPRELLDDGKYGLLFPVGDFSELAKQMTVIVQQPEQREPLERYGREFTLSGCSKKYLNYFLSIIP